jgi:molecular chaperone DnaK (HSP70)
MTNIQVSTTLVNGERVTGAALGIEGFGGMMIDIVHMNTRLPTSVGMDMETACDDQTDAEIIVLQGNSDFARDNRTLSFRRIGIPARPRGTAVTIVFSIDLNGILQVHSYMCLLQSYPP